MILISTGTPMTKRKSCPSSFLDHSSLYRHINHSFIMNTGATYLHLHVYSIHTQNITFKIILAPKFIILQLQITTT